MLNLPKKSLLLAMVLLLLAALIGGCARLPRTTVTSIKAANTVELRGHLLKRKPDVDIFRSRGPFAVDTKKDFVLQLPEGERIPADLYLSAPAEKTSLVIFLHGLDNAKDDHAYQAMHVASWGFHSLVLQLPNKGPWTNNGQTMARIADFIFRQPEIIDSRIDAGRLILVGHSYGGSAVAVAMAEGAPAMGSILLDPAGIGRNLPSYLSRIVKPMIVIGADEKVSQTRDRDNFYYYVRSGVTEVSIKDASHEDAQYRAEYPVQLFASSAPDTEEQQITFVSALTSAAFSLSATGKLDYAWSSFGEAIKSGRLFNARRK
jgi:pimeloyl-ACP methyl ester carboxylesterase